MALSILSLGRLWPLALSTARRRRGLEPRSPPPIFAATVISLISLVKTLPRFASWRPLRCWMLAHLEWPAMVSPSGSALIECRFYPTKLPPTRCHDRLLACHPRCPGVFRQGDSRQAGLRHGACGGGDPARPAHGLCPAGVHLGRAAPVPPRVAADRPRLGRRGRPGPAWLLWRQHFRFRRPEVHLRRPGTADPVHLPDPDRAPGCFLLRPLHRPAGSGAAPAVLRWHRRRFHP